MIKVNFEVTDTLGGEANYSWVKRGSLEFKLHPTQRQVIQALKKFAGLTGIKCRKDDYGDQIALHPAKMCIVAFAIMEY
jgi:S-adenosylmethionine synthetase